MEDDFELVDEDEIELDSEDLLIQFKKWKLEKRRCCGRACFEHFRETDAKQLWLNVESMLRFGPSGAITSTGKAIVKVFIATIYKVSQYKVINKNLQPLQRVNEFIIPYYPRHCCRLFFRSILGMGDRAFNTMTERARTTVVPAVHALTGRSGNDANRFNETTVPVAKVFVRELAKRHGMPWPVRVRVVSCGTEDEIGEDEFMNTEYIMPASFTKREMHRLLLARYPDNTLDFKTFRRILETPELANIRINKSEKGVCGTCLSLCSSLRKQRSDGSVVQRMSLLERVRVHLNLATAARRMYQEDCVAAKAGHYSVVSWDFATKVKVPKFQYETQGAFQAAVHGLDYNVFGIVNEAATKKMQTNLVFKEGRKVYADVVISLVHYYLTHINPRAGKASVLVLWVDSCSGQNRNQYLLQYLYTRILHGLNTEIRIKFMVRTV
tara:strand:- start:1189 stop:2505 length:1317 start_codon:yes stop_codon:yes gene_type:complete